MGYEYAIGTAPYPSANWNSIRGWTSVGTDTEVTATGLIFASTTYYISVRTVNGTGLASVAASDGITVDAGAPQIGSIADNGSETPQYEKYDATFTIKTKGESTPGSKVFANDYNGYNPFSPKLDAYDINSPYAWKGWPGIYVDAVITKPDGQEIRWPCFYDYDRNGDGTHEWKFRFAPTETGTWSYKIEVRHKPASGTTTYLVTSPSNPFTCVENTSGLSRRGFLTVDAADHRFFSFSNGDVLYPMGVHVSNNYDDANDNGHWDPGEVGDIEDLGSNGGNWSRVFQASYMFEEWTGNGDEVNRFDDSENGEEKALYWDRYFNRCRDAGVYVI